MQENNRLQNLISSYIEENDTNPRRLAKEINTQVGIPDAINYNTIYYWSKGVTRKPNSSLVLVLLRERGSGKLKELAKNILELQN